MLTRSDYSKYISIQQGNISHIMHDIWFAWYIVKFGMIIHISHYYSMDIILDKDILSLLDISNRYGEFIGFEIFDISKSNLLIC